MVTSFLLAIRAISRNRVRAGLTMLGILIGVAALIAVTTLASGVSARISGSIKALASNAMTIHAAAPVLGRKTTIRPLTDGDAHAIAREVRSAEHVAPVLQGLTPLTYGSMSENVNAVGTTLEYFAVNQMTFARGGPWTVGQETRKEKVCVLGSAIAGELFGPAEPLGQTIRVAARSPCRVVGVLRPTGGGAFGMDPDSVVVMPIGSFRARVRSSGADQLDEIVVSASSEYTARAEKQIDSLLRQRHRIRSGEPPDFQVSTAGELQQMQLIIAGALSALLSCVASVSLIVGGIGVMNIMLVSVAERTREIGIRISIGATSKDILSQFLIEAIVLTSVGGFLGLVIGALGSRALGKVVGFELAPSPAVALLAVATSGGIGILFGYLPARRAAALDPIQALRSE